MHYMLRKKVVNFFTVIIPEIWNPPDDWTSPDLPSVYRSLDNDKYVQLENGAQVVAGKVGHLENDVYCTDYVFTSEGGYETNFI